MEIFALQIRIHSSNTDNTQCCCWVGNSPSLTQCCWQCKLFSFLESSLADIPRTLKMLIPCDPGVQFLGIYSEEATMNVQKKFMGKKAFYSLTYNNENSETTHIRQQWSFGSVGNHSVGLQVNMCSFQIRQTLQTDRFLLSLLQVH